MTVTAVARFHFRACLRLDFEHSALGLVRFHRLERNVAKPFLLKGGLRFILGAPHDVGDGTRGCNGDVHRGARWERANLQRGR